MLETQRPHVNRRRELFNEHRPWTLADEPGILRKAGPPSLRHKLSADLGKQACEMSLSPHYLLA